MAGPADNEKQAILNELAAARSQLASTGAELRRALDVGGRAKDSFKRHRSVWLGGAALAGLVLSKIPARSRTVFVERVTGKALGSMGKLGAAWSVAKIAFDLAKPLVGDIAGKGLGELAKRFSRKPGNPASRPPGPPGM